VVNSLFHPDTLNITPATQRAASSSAPSAPRRGVAGPINICIGFIGDVQQGKAQHSGRIQPAAA
jgi:hypothetical protein